MLNKTNPSATVSTRPHMDYTRTETGLTLQEAKTDCLSYGRAIAQTRNNHNKKVLYI
jgi:hypothetical protein